MQLTIDLDFAQEHSLGEAVLLALLRKNEVLRYSERMSNPHCLFSLYHMYGRGKIDRDLDKLEAKGYCTMHEVYYRGKYPHKIYKLTDKAWKEYNFGE